MKDVYMTNWFRIWSIRFAVGLHSPNHANHGKPITKVWTVLPSDGRNAILHLLQRFAFLTICTFTFLVRYTF